MRVGSDRMGVEVIPDSDRIKALKKSDRNRNAFQMKIETKLQDSGIRVCHKTHGSDRITTVHQKRSEQSMTIQKRTDRLSVMQKRSERMTVQNRFDSQAPIRKSGTCFDFDSSLTSVNAIKKALFEKDPDVETEISPRPTTLSTSAPPSTTISSLLGNFEESVLNGRIEPVSTVQGFTAEIGASGDFCPRHKTLPVTVFFYTLQDTDKVDRVSSPYLGHINLGKKDYHIPRKGTVQTTLFNPHGTVVKMFVIRYDLSDMPPNSKTFLRQRTLFMPSDANENDADNRKWLRYLIHLRIESSKSGRIYLHTDVRIIVFRKHDLDVATMNGVRPYELRSFTQCPVNPKYS